MLVHPCDRREPLEAAPEVVAQVAHEAAGERRRRRPRRGLATGLGCARHTVQAPQERARLRERVRALGRRVEHRERIGREEAPPARASRARALEQGEPRQVAETLRDVHRGNPVHRGDAQHQRRAAGSGSGFRDHRHPAMIGVPHRCGRNRGAEAHVRARELGLQDRPARHGGARRDHGRPGRQRGPYDADPRRWAAGRRTGTRQDGRHGRRPARGRRVDRTRVRGLSPPQRERGAHGPRVGARVRVPRWCRGHHEHALRRRGARRTRGPRGPSPRSERGVLVPPGRGRDVRRRPQRHQRLPRDGGTPGRRRSPRRRRARSPKATSAAGPG